MIECTSACQPWWPNVAFPYTSITAMGTIETLCRASQLSNVIVRVFLSWIIFHTFMANLLSTNGLKQMGPSTWIVWHNRSPSTRVPLGLQSIAPVCYCRPTSTPMTLSNIQQHLCKKNKSEHAPGSFPAFFGASWKKNTTLNLRGP